MKKIHLKEKIPTFVGIWEKRQEAKRNQLPKHLRPLPRWPIVVQIVLNSAILVTLSWLMLNQDEFVTEAAPASVMVVCFLLMIYALITAFQLKVRYTKLKGERLTHVNVWLMGIAFLTWVLAIINFIP